MAGGPFSRRRAARGSLAALTAGLCVTLGAPAPATAQVGVSLNALIRQGEIFDGVIDFEAALDDPARPGRIRAGAYREDGCRPNDEGAA